MDFRYKFFFCAFLLLSWTANVAAQEYTWKAPVAAATEDGYYRIPLAPDVRGRLRADLSDIRLLNELQQEVPYLVRKEQPLQYTRLFKPYTILSYSRKKGCCSELLVENEQKRKIDNISLLIRNADVRKEITLSGSDNRQDWYVLKAKDVLHAINNRESTAEVKLLNFPLNNYRYLLLQFNDSASAALNILEAGYYDTYTEAGKYSPIPVKKVSHTDSIAVKKTYIRLRFGQPVYPDRLQFTIKQPQLYHRSGSVILGPENARVSESRRKRKRRRQQAIVTTVPFILDSNSPAVVEMPQEKVEELTIVIDNADSPPLTISSVQALQLNTYLVASLNKEQRYTLYFGNDRVSAPSYDLQYFQDSIPVSTPVLQTGAVEQPQYQEEKQASTSKMAIWAAIGLVVIGLGYMTVKLLNDMDKKKVS